jgi:hypothetical protein
MSDRDIGYFQTAVDSIARLADVPPDKYEDIVYLRARLFDIAILAGSMQTALLDFGNRNMSMDELRMLYNTMSEQDRQMLKALFDSATNAAGPKP